ncbi:MAG: M20/M25/M40 family metallo-hydrolase [Aggregatilineales bacterium]
MSRKITKLIPILTLFILSACNLGAPRSSVVTLAPRASSTPPPTLGVFSEVGAAGTVVPGDVNIAITNPDVQVEGLVNQIDAGRMMAHVTNLQNFYTRHVNSSISDETQGIGAARAYIYEQFRALQQSSNGRVYAYPFEFDMTYNGRSTLQENVVAVVQGTEPGAGTLVVGAHYDSIKIPFSDNTGFAPGANDNATGVAAIIEMARVLSKAQYRASIMFVAFSAEEVERKGSRALAQYLAERNFDLIGMVNIDSIGNEHDENGNVNSTEMRVFSDGPNDVSASRHMARTAEFISFTHGLDMKLIVEDAIDRENRYGDHFSFSEVGYPAIRFISAFEEKKNGDITDTVEFVEPDYLERAVQSILIVITAMADGPRPPLNIALRTDNNAQTLIWEDIPGAAGYVIALRRAGSLRYDQQIETSETRITWDGFGSYAGISIAARGTNGILGPLSPEYRVR